MESVHLIEMALTIVTSSSLPDGILSIPIYIDSKPTHDSEISNNSWNLHVELVIQREVSSFDEGVHVCERAYGWGFFTN